MATSEPSAGPHRLFFALWPDDALREAIARTAASIEAGHAPGGRGLRAERYHLTLQFLGDFSPLPPRVTDAARAAAAQVQAAAFELALDRVGSFSGSRVWWLGCSEAPDALLHLWRALGAALDAAGVAVNAHPAFTPHLTIRRGVRRRIATQPIAPLHWRVREFVLIDSQAACGYVRIGRWPLHA